MLTIQVKVESTLRYNTSNFNAEVIDSEDNISRIYEDGVLVAEGSIITGLGSTWFNLEKKPERSPSKASVIVIHSSTALRETALNIQYEFLAFAKRQKKCIDQTYGPKGKTGFSKNPYRGTY